MKEGNNPLYKWNNSCFLNGFSNRAVQQNLPRNLPLNLWWRTAPRVLVRERFPPLQSCNFLKVAARQKNTELSEFSTCSMFLSLPRIGNYFSGIVIFQGQQIWDFSSSGTKYLKELSWFVTWDKTLFTILRLWWWSWCWRCCDDDDDDDADDGDDDTILITKLQVSSMVT